MSSSCFYGNRRPEPSFPSGITAAGDGGYQETEWLGKGAVMKDTTKLDRAMSYITSKDQNLESKPKRAKNQITEKVNSTGNPVRGIRGPRTGRGRGQGRLDLKGYGSKMLIASLSKQDKENKVSGSMSELIPSLDRDLCKATTPDSKSREKDFNSNQAPFGSFNGNRTPSRTSQGSTFKFVASSTPSTSAIAPHQIGFQNYKNTCYMLAPLQVLQGIPSIVSSSLTLANLVEDWEDRQRILGNGDKSNIMKASELALPWSLLCNAREKGDLSTVTTQVGHLMKCVK